MNTKLIQTENKSECCEFVSNPSSHCHCLQITSRSVPNIIKYCMDSYHNCPIYIKLMEARKRIDISGNDILQVEECL